MFDEEKYAARDAASSISFINDCGSFLISLINFKALSNFFGLSTSLAFKQSAEVLTEDQDSVNGI